MSELSLGCPDVASLWAMEFGLIQEGMDQNLDTSEVFLLAETSFWNRAHTWQRWSYGDFLKLYFEIVLNVWKNCSTDSLLHPAFLTWVSYETTWHSSQGINTGVILTTKYRLHFGSPRFSPAVLSCPRTPSTMPFCIWSPCRYLESLQTMCGCVCECVDLCRHTSWGPGVAATN